MNPVVAFLSTWIIASACGQLIIPDTFDARVQWPNCPSIANVPNQGCCNASYALIPAAVLTDRVCIQSNGTVSRTFSAYDALSCCVDCAYFPLQQCLGGYPEKVWNYYVTTGLVSESCMPFTLLNSLCLGAVCPLFCASTQGFSASVASDKRFGAEIHTFSTVIDIQAEIYTKGPVISNLEGTPFVSLSKREVNTQSSGPSLGRQSVKMIGWGTDQGTPYWLVIGAFGPNWGDNGVAKILRGSNFLGIEQNASAGIPRL